MAVLGVGMVGFVQGQARPSRAHLALSNAIEHYRRGDYEMAANFFQQAQDGQEDLTTAERQDLANGHKDWKRLEWMGFSSMATKKTAFYLDNLALTHAARQPPATQPAVKATTRPASTRPETRKAAR